MNLKLFSLGLIILAGCGTPDSPKAAAPTEPAEKSTSLGRNNISVPNMT